MGFHHHTTLMALLALLVLIAVIPAAQCQAVTIYRIQIKTDNSAAWTIITATDGNVTPDSWQGFQQRVNNMIGTSAAETHRNMSSDPNSFQMVLQEATVQYEFTWLNMSRMENQDIVFGDVFVTQDCFTQLYGNGIVEITYPSSYSILAVSPAPNQRDDAQRYLGWLSTQNFANSKPNIIFRFVASTSSNNPGQAGTGVGLQPYVVASVGSVLAISVVLASIYAVKRRKNAVPNQRANSPALLVESEEDKIVKILKSRGGNSFQSALTEESKFSKAKTSQLLTILESRGVVRRYKKGRDKIVTLVEKGKSDRT